jgi:hypothetical protein
MLSTTPKNPISPTQILLLVGPFSPTGGDDVTNVFRKSSINERLPDKTAAIKSVFRNNGFISPVVGITIKSLTGKEIITEINNENHDCVGQNGTIIMAFSTVSDLILDKILGIKLKGGKIYGLIFD